MSWSIDSDRSTEDPFLVSNELLVLRGSCIPEKPTTWIHFTMKVFKNTPSHHSRSFPNFPPAWIHSNDEWRNANTNWRLFWFRIRVVHPSPLFWYKDPTLGWCWMDLCQRWLTHTHTHFLEMKTLEMNPVMPIPWYRDKYVFFGWLSKKKRYILGTS